jgi:N6-L-threonylcarbamoyladenine synthase
VILAVETSCDDTCVALVTSDGAIRANVISSQGIHDRYGGVVPEIASRHHLTLLGPALDDALRVAGA